MSPAPDALLTWLGILLCVSQSAMFSGLNLAFFSVSRLRLEADAVHDPRAATVLAMRQDANYLLTTILWGNVAANTMLALLSNSVMTGVVAFLFSTLLITLVGEIMPQAWFSRRALANAARFAPVLRAYQVLLMPLALPSARLLDRWLGRESVQYMREQTLRNIILQHLSDGSGDINEIEGLGALNFLDLDDMLASGHAEPVHAESVIRLPKTPDGPAFPDYAARADDPFVRQVHASGMKWVVLTDPAGEPQALLNADEFLRDLFCAATPQPVRSHSHQPLVFRDPRTPLGDVISAIRQQHPQAGDQPLRRDVALLWTPTEHRLITGSDILADLLRGLRTKS